MEKITPQPTKKPKYRVLISTRGKISFREDYDKYNVNNTFKTWRKNIMFKYTRQGNQVNYFIPINE